MDGKNIILITGANQGIGFETAKNLLLASEQWHVLLGSRDMSKGTKAIEQLRSLPIKGSVEPLHLDVTSDDSVDAAATYISQQFGRLDTLVNNAGISSMTRGRAIARQIFETNVLGVISVTDAMLPLLKKSATPRMVFVSSTMGCLTAAADPSSPMHFDFANEYRASKAALNMLMVQYQQYSIQTSHGFDPGMVATNFGAAGEEALQKKRARGAVEPEVAAEKLVGIIRGDWDAEKGRVVGPQGVLPW